MSNDKNAASSAVLYFNGPATFRLDGELIVLELPSGAKVVCGTMSAADFIESFSRAAEVAHQWSRKQYWGDGVHPRRAQ